MLDEKFQPVAAIICRSDSEPHPGGGSDLVAVEERADDITALVAALRLPDQSVRDCHGEFWAQYGVPRRGVLRRCVHGEQRTQSDVAARRHRGHARLPLPEGRRPPGRQPALRRDSAAVRGEISAAGPAASCDKTSPRFAVLRENSWDRPISVEADGCRRVFIEGNQFHRGEMRQGSARLVSLLYDR